MEFEKNTNYDSDASTGNGVEKRKKKSRKKKLVAPVPIDASTRQAIQGEAAPVPASKKREKSPKNSKKAEKAATPKSAPKEVVKKTREKPEAAPKVTSETETEHLVVPESSDIEESAEKPRATEETSKVSEGPETVISLNETTDDEGMIFVSDRLRKQQASENPNAETSEEYGHEDDGESIESPEDADKAIEATDETLVPKKRTRKKSTQASTSDKGSSTKTGQAGTLTNSVPAERPTKEATPVAVATSTSGGASERVHDTPSTPETPEPTLGGGGFVPPERSRAVSGGEAQETPSIRTRIFGNLTPERAERGNTRRERHGFVQGVLLGAIVEHIRHKRREKRMTKAHTREVKVTEKEHTANVERLEQSAKREKTTLERQLERLRGETAASPKEVDEAKRYQPKAEQRPEKQIVSASPSERVVPVVARHEESAQEAGKRAERVDKKPVAEVRPTDEVEEALQLPPDHKIESSAWHNIEVDKRTGKAVEDPTLVYGEEFKHEQHQEQLRKQIADMSLESDRVRENYLFKSVSSQQQTTKQKATTPSPTIPPPAPKVRKSESVTKIAAQKAQQRIAHAEPVDIALWGVLVFVVIIIIALL